MCSSVVEPSVSTCEVLDPIPSVKENKKGWDERKKKTMRGKRQERVREQSRERKRKRKITVLFQILYFGWFSINLIQLTFLPYLC